MSENMIYSTALGYLGRQYGSGSWHGVTNGAFVAEMMEIYRAQHVLDPMAGSGTIAEVCQDFGIPCLAYDIQPSGTPLVSPLVRPDTDVLTIAGRKKIEDDVNALTEGKGVDFIWWDPPYWRMAHYSDNPNDFCNGPYPTYLQRMYSTMTWLSTLAAQDAVLAIEMADYRTTEGGTILINDDIMVTEKIARTGWHKELRFTRAYQPRVRDTTAWVNHLKRLRGHPGDRTVQIDHEYLTILRLNRRGDPPLFQQ